MNDINFGAAPIGEKRDPRRIEPILELLREIWTRQPDTRLGQLIRSAIFMGTHPDNPEPNSAADISLTEDNITYRGLRMYKSGLLEEGLWDD